MRRRLPTPTAEFLQWFGLGGAALTWAAQLVVGYGTTVARCGAGGARFGIDLFDWELAPMLAALLLALTAEAAAITTVIRTWGAEYAGPPPDGRRHFFALAATVGNLLFVGAILLSGIASLVHEACRQG
jgi:predicted small integral membrane protein